MLATALLLALTATAPIFFPATPAPSVGAAPPIAEVQRRAIDYARLDPSEISSWKKRSRLAALLPKFQVDYGMRLKNEVNVNVNESVYVGSTGVTVGPDENGATSNANTDQNIGVRAIWSFNEAIFNPDMLAVSEESRLLARERNTLLAEVNRNYYERDRAAGEIALLAREKTTGPGADKIRREIFLKRVALDEATAALDALTGGWFGKQLREEP